MHQPRVIDDPHPGFFSVRLCRKGPRVPARIVQDSDGWTVFVLGKMDKLRTFEAADHPGVMRVWQSGKIIDSVDYELMLATHAWALVNQPDHPLCHPYEPVRVAALQPIIPRRTR